MKISMRKCKKRLATLWFSGAAVLFFLLFFQTIFGHYGERASEAWGWLLPTIVPTLSLIIGVLVMEALDKTSRTETIDSFVYHLALGLSVVYLAVVILTIVVEPFTAMSPLKLMQEANVWLGSFQGLVTGSLGAFFVKKEKKST